MLKRSRQEQVAGNPGDNVIIPIPLVDRGRGDPRNIMGVVLEINENDMYCIAVRAGILKGSYSRNQFDLSPSAVQCERFLHRQRNRPATSCSTRV